MKNRSKFQKIIGWCISILVPLIIIMISIRLLISPIFAQVEYRMPGFPEDPFGFTLEDRVKWSQPSINYLVNTKDIQFLEALQFDSGVQIFNDRELDHMQDVKGVVTVMRIALASSLIVLMVINFVAVKGDWTTSLLLALRRGGWEVIGIILTILIFVIISFQQLFTRFHQLFFKSGTWKFYTSDTLIRLFPMRFWQDAFIFVSVLSLILGAIIIVICNKRLET